MKSLEENLAREKDANKALASQRNEAEKKFSDLRATLEEEFNAKKALAFKTMELEYKEKSMKEKAELEKKFMEDIQKGNENNFEKLKTALAKLHEEGNAQTKFTEQIALKMMDNMKPSARHIDDKSM